MQIGEAADVMVYSEPDARVYYPYGVAMFTDTDVTIPPESPVHLIVVADVPVNAPEGRTLGLKTGIFRWTALAETWGEAADIPSPEEWAIARIGRAEASARPTDVQAQTPATFELRQNTPNPFNPTTAITFSITKDSPVRLAVYDVNGRLLRTLADRAMSAGTHGAVWDGRDARGHAVASGVYVYRLTTDEGTLVRRMMLVR